MVLRFLGKIFKTLTEHPHAKNSRSCHIGFLTPAYHYPVKRYDPHLTQGNKTVVRLGDLLKASKGEQGQATGFHLPPELLPLRCLSLGGRCWPRGYTILPVRGDTSLHKFSWTQHGSLNTGQMIPVVFKQKESDLFQLGKKTTGSAGFTCS